jgi:hypothetical protein
LNEQIKSNRTARSSSTIAGAVGNSRAQQEFLMFEFLSNRREPWEEMSSTCKEAAQSSSFKAEFSVSCRIGSVVRIAQVGDRMK